MCSQNPKRRHVAVLTLDVDGQGGAPGQRLALLRIIGGAVRQDHADGAVARRDDGRVAVDGYRLAREAARGADGQVGVVRAGGVPRCREQDRAGAPGVELQELERDDLERAAVDVDLLADTDRLSARELPVQRVRGRGTPRRWAERMGLRVIDQVDGSNWDGVLIPLGTPQ